MRKRQALACVLITGWVTATSAQETHSLKPLPDWAARVRPGIERVLGYDVPTPTFELAGRKPDSTIRDIQAHLRWRFPHLDREAYGIALAEAFDVSKQASLVQFVEGT